MCSVVAATPLTLQSPPIPGPSLAWLKVTKAAVKAVRKSLEPPQPAANGHLELEGFDLPPSRQAAVRFKGAG